MQNVKSATTAGLLGIFLGAVGAHSWYLGDKKNGIIHVSLAGGALVLIIIAAIITASSATSLYGMASYVSGGFAWTAILSGLGALIMAGNGIWAFVEGIILLSQGDAGLARKGYAVANPASMNYNQGYNNQNYNQGYGPQGYNQQGYGPEQNWNQNGYQGEGQNNYDNQNYNEQGGNGEQNGQMNGEGAQNGQ